MNIWIAEFMNMNISISEIFEYLNINISIFQIYEYRWISMNISKLSMNIYMSTRSGQFCLDHAFVSVLYRSPAELYDFWHHVWSVLYFKTKLCSSRHAVYDARNWRRGKCHEFRRDRADAVFSWQWKVGVVCRWNMDVNFLFEYLNIYLTIGISEHI